MTADAYGYTRLSQQSKTSIEDQINAIRRYCARHDIELQDILDDGKYQSGYSTEERHEYNRLKELIQNGDAGAVIVRGTERLGRDFDERSLFVTLCRQHNVELHNTERGEIPVHDPLQAAVELIRAANDDSGMRKYIERAKEAKRKKRKRGDYDGDVPMGTRYTEDKTSLEANENFEMVLEIIAAKDEGATHREVAEEFNVSTGAVSKILDRREMYEYMDTHGSWRPADTEPAYASDN